MGRESKALITRSLPVLEDRIEILVARSHLEHRWGPCDDQVAEEHLVTMLVSFDPTDDDRWAARALAGRYIAAELSLWQKAADLDLHDWLVKFAGGIVGGLTLTIVLALPDEWSARMEQQVSEFLARVRAGNDRIQLIAGVASRTSSWTNCSGVDGFVVCVRISAHRGQHFKLMVDAIST